MLITYSIFRFTYNNFYIYKHHRKQIIFVSDLICNYIIYIVLQEKRFHPFLFSYSAILLYEESLISFLLKKFPNDCPDFFFWLEYKLNGYFGLEMQIGCTRSTKVAGGLLASRTFIDAYLLSGARRDRQKGRFSLRPSFVIREIRDTRLLSVERGGSMANGGTYNTHPLPTPAYKLLIYFETLPRIVLRELKYSAP